jgi:hypothetical protein
MDNPPRVGPAQLFSSCKHSWVYTTNMANSHPAKSQPEIMQEENNW